MELYSIGGAATVCDYRSLDCRASLTTIGAAPPRHIAVSLRLTV